jgi:hypothetical protein
MVNKTPKLSIVLKDDDDMAITTQNFEFPSAFIKILIADAKYFGVKQDCGLMGNDSVESGS